MDYLYILREALVWTITIFWLYQIMVSLCSLVKIKDKPLKVKKDHRFMAIIPAHNEEAVIGNLIESLNKQNYNRELYDIYVIADNCTDNTAEVAKRHPGELRLPDHPQDHQKRNIQKQPHQNARAPAPAPPRLRPRHTRRRPPAFSARPQTVWQSASQGFSPAES